MASLRVISPGMLTTIQDQGRWGWQSRGVPVAGPMDPRAHRLANILVGNETNASTVEVTLVGPELEFDDTRIVAVTGGDFEVVVDGVAQPINSAFEVSEGSVLRFGARRRGARAYLAISGGVAVPRILGSRATHLPTRLGGVDGRPLRAGDRLALDTAGPKSPPAGVRAETVADPGSLPEGHATVRVLPGPQLDWFAPDALDVLQSASYSIEPNSNRMGFRLKGERLTHASDAEMLSEATTFGAVQVPASGQPILLMADRQTSGGYPTVATLISADLGLAGQLAPGDTVSFVVSTLREAMAALIAQEQALMAVESSWTR